MFKLCTWRSLTQCLSFLLIAAITPCILLWNESLYQPINTFTGTTGAVHNDGSIANSSFSTHGQESQDTDATIRVNSSYFQQWFGSSINNYASTNDGLCHIPSLFFLWHHKSGGYFKNWIPIIAKHCDAIQLVINFNNEMTKIQWNNQSISMLKHVGSTLPHNQCVSHDGFDCLSVIINEMNASWTAMNITSVHQQQLQHSLFITLQERDRNALIASTSIFDALYPMKNRIVIMMVRKPLDSILSGYNYHSMGNEMKWTDSNLTAYKRKGVILQNCFRNIWNPEEFVIDRGTTMYKEYEKGYRSNYSDHKALQYGLYLEFTRFVNCEWPLQIGIYEEIKNDNNGRYQWFLFVRFEWFQEYGYAESIAYLLEQLTSQKIDYQSIDLFNDLMDREKTDGFLCPLSDQQCNAKNTKAHATKGSYDRELQIQLLFEKDTRICLMLRNMTVAMDGTWLDLNVHC